MNLFVLYTYIKARAATAEERGANLVEYILLVAFIALLVVAAIVGLKAAIKGKFDSSKNCLNTVSDTTTSC
jgi:Flp pilus assembly pilin Flp